MAGRGVNRGGWEGESVKGQGREGKGFRTQPEGEKAVRGRPWGSEDHKEGCPWSLVCERLWTSDFLTGT